MNRFVVFAILSIALSACKTTEHSVQVDGDSVTPGDCASADVQRLITFCASPQAADLAGRNAELMAGGGGDVPYSPLPVGDSPVLGPEDAPVTIVFFTDLECPYCQELHHTLTALQKERPEDLRIVFKHTPLAFHPGAVPAALGALAAREQGKFWEYVDRVFADQSDLGNQALMDHAAALDLDLEQFRNDYGTESHIAAIEADLGLARQAGVQGTPTMFVNGIRVVGVYPEAEVAALVENQKQLVDRLREAGVDADDLYWRMVAVQYDEQAAPAEQQPQQAPEPEATVVALVPTDGAPARGAAPEDALVTIVEFSDFQCSFCADAVGELDALVEADDAVRLVYRHFPLPNHPDATPAAVASVVAAEAGKFWEFHDLLFANQADLSEGALMKYAEEVGLDPVEVAAALDAEEFAARVASDQKIGQEHGVQGTPTLFVNGIMVLGIADPDEFRALVREQRELGEKVVEETGLAGDALYRELVKRNRETLTP